MVVHEAQKLRRPGELVPLVKAGREAAGLYLLFVSAETDFPRDGRGEGQLAPHLAAIRDARHGQLIRCTTPKEDDLLDWVARQWPGLGRNAAHRLLERAGGDLAAVRGAGAKARACGLLDEKYIPVLCEPPPGGQFAELLIARGPGRGAGRRPYWTGAAWPGDRAARFPAGRAGGDQGGPAPSAGGPGHRGQAGCAQVPDRQVPERRARRMARPGCGAAGSCWPPRMRRGGTGASAGVAEVLAANW